MINQFTLPSDKTIIQQISSALATRIGSWFGDSATLQGEPELRKFRYSFFLRFGIHSPQKETGLLVKIQRRPEMKGLGEAVVSESLRSSGRSEYETELKTWRVFSQVNDPYCVAVQPFAYLTDWNAIVMPELSLRPLKSLLLRSRVLFRSESGIREIEMALRHSARWLKIFHTYVGGLQWEPYSKNVLRRQINTELDYLHDSSRGAIKIEPLRVGFMETLSRIPDDSVPQATLHDDFQWSNIMLTTSDRICALDPRHNRQAPVYADLATLLVDPETRFVQIAANGYFFSRLHGNRIRQAVLETYFEDGCYDVKALNLYCALAILHKWSKDEQSLSAEKKTSFPFPFFTRSAHRRYFSRLLETYLEKKL